MSNGLRKRLRKYFIAKNQGVEGQSVGPRNQRGVRLNVEPTDGELLSLIENMQTSFNNNCTIELNRILGDRNFFNPLIGKHSLLGMRSGSTKQHKKYDEFPNKQGEQD